MVKVCFEASWLTFSELERIAGGKKRVGDLVTKIVSTYIDVVELEEKKKQLEETIDELQLKTNEMMRLLSRAQIIGIRNPSDPHIILLYDNNGELFYIVDTRSHIVVEAPELFEWTKTLTQLVQMTKETGQR